MFLAIIRVFRQFELENQISNFRTQILATNHVNLIRPQRAFGVFMFLAIIRVFRQFQLIFFIENHISISNSFLMNQILFLVFRSFLLMTSELYVDIILDIFSSNSSKQNLQKNDFNLKNYSNTKTTSVMNGKYK